MDQTSAETSQNAHNNALTKMQLEKQHDVVGEILRKKRNPGNFWESANVPRCARGRKPTFKYLFRRYCRRGRGRGTPTKKPTLKNAGKREKETTNLSYVNESTQPTPRALLCHNSHPCDRKTAPTHQQVHPHHTRCKSIQQGG